MEGDGSEAAIAIDPVALQEEMLELVKGFVGADVAPDQPLVSQGLDSLAAMELRQKLQVSSLPQPPISPDFHA